MKYVKAIQTALCIVLLLALCGCAAAEARIAISCPYSPDGWPAAAARSAETTAEELGMNYMLKTAGSAQEQSEDLDMMIEQGFSHIILCPVDDSVEAAAKRAMKAGATLLCFGSVPGELVPDYSLTFDDAQLGELAADFLGEKLGGEGRVALVTRTTGASGERRAAACRDALGERYPDMEITGSYAVDGAEDIETRIGEILDENPQLDGVCCCDEALASDMLRFLDAQNRLGDGGVRALICCGASGAFFDCMDEYGDRIALAALTASPCALGELVRACDGLIRGEELQQRAVIAPETASRRWHIAGAV